MRQALMLLLLLVVVMVGLFLGSRNAQPVTLDYFYGQATMPLSVAVLLSLVTGILLGSLSVWLGTVIRLKARIRRLKREIDRPREPSTERLTADR